MPRKARSGPPSPRVEIEASKPDTGDAWVFSVSLVLSEHDRRTVWLGSSYEAAILIAEERARMRRGMIALVLPVWDRVVPAS